MFGVVWAALAGFGLAGWRESNQLNSRILKSKDKLIELLGEGSTLLERAYKTECRRQAELEAFRTVLREIGIVVTMTWEEENGTDKLNVVATNGLTGESKSQSIH